MSQLNGKGLQAFAHYIITIFYLCLRVIKYKLPVHLQKCLLQRVCFPSSLEISTKYAKLFAYNCRHKTPCQGSCQLRPAMYHLTDGSCWHASCLQLVPMLIRTPDVDSVSVLQIPATVTPQSQAEDHDTDASELLLLLLLQRPDLTHPGCFQDFDTSFHT